MKNLCYIRNKSQKYDFIQPKNKIFTESKYIKNMKQGQLWESHDKQKFMKIESDKILQIMSNLNLVTFTSEERMTIEEFVKKDEWNGDFISEISRTNSIFFFEKKDGSGIKLTFFKLEDDYYLLSYLGRFNDLSSGVYFCDELTSLDSCYHCLKDSKTI